MICAFCGRDVWGTTNLIPEETPGKVHNSAFACELCVREYGVWCEEHQQLKVGFVGRGIACLACIRELALGLIRDYAHCIEDDIQARVSAEAWHEIVELAEISAVGSAIVATGKAEDAEDAPLFDGLAIMAAAAMILGGWDYKGLLYQIEACGAKALTGRLLPLM